MRRQIGFCLFAIVLLTVSSGEAQQPAKLPTVGLLGAASASSYSPFVEAFRQGIHDRGYVEGKNVAVEYRWAEGKYDRLPDLAAELVRLKVDVILTHGTPGTQAAKQATATIPIVMTVVGERVGSGLVASLARPGGNITGTSILAPEVGAKRLELLKAGVAKGFPHGRPRECGQCGQWTHGEVHREAGPDVESPASTGPSTSTQ